MFYRKESQVEDLFDTCSKEYEIWIINMFWKDIFKDVSNKMLAKTS